MIEPRPVFAGLPNWLTAAASQTVNIYASSESSSLTPVENLREPETFRPWMSATSSPLEDAWIKWDYGGASRTASHVGIWGYVAPFESEIRGRLFGDFESESDPIRDTGWLPSWYAYLDDGTEDGLPWGEFLWGARAPQRVLRMFQRFVTQPFLNAAQDGLDIISHKSGRFDMRVIAGATVSETEWKASYVDCSEAWMVSCPPVWGRTRTGRFHANRQVGIGGAVSTTFFGRSADQRFRFEALKRIEAADKIEELNGRGPGDPVIIIQQPNRPEFFFRDAGLYTIPDHINTEVTPLWRDSKPAWRTSWIEPEEWR